MANASKVRHVFPLTSLQIGDLQSYLSDISFFLARESKKFYVLVDNRPWLKDLAPRSAHLWQLMVTKSRLSPFANTKAQKERKRAGELKASPESGMSKWKALQRWFSVIDTLTLSQKRALLPVKELRNSLISNGKLHRTLYGFIVFEVAWSDVHGINYLNELQTDTCLAIEAKFMKKWEFDSIPQAAKCMSFWFSGTHHEQLQLKEYLDSAVGEVFYDVQETFKEGSSFVNNESSCSDDWCCLHSGFNLCPANTANELSTPGTPPSPNEPYKKRKVMKSISTGFFDIYPEETHDKLVNSPLHTPISSSCDCQDAVEASRYKDVLIQFRFNDCNLPFELRDIFMSDLRLLTLLESGLPSWVIFLQSYPGFCHLYRPWIYPMARTLYVLISLVTVVIGFYDLYKNIPILKATASRLFGPLFDWIETWEMVSRVTYLGTMLFLHNLEKAVKWFLMTTRTFRSFILILTEPMQGPLMEFMDFILPLWNIHIETVESICSMFWTVVESSFSLVDDLVEMVLLPVWFLLSYSWTIAMSIIYPVLWILGETLCAPVRLVIGMSHSLTFFYTCIYEFLRDIWLFISSAVKLASNAGTTVTAHEVPNWNSLQNDLLSKIFRAVRTILKGCIAFFSACNRHRLSIYNHAHEFIQKLFCPTQRLGPVHSGQRQMSGIQSLSETCTSEQKSERDEGRCEDTTAAAIPVRRS